MPRHAARFWSQRAALAAEPDVHSAGGRPPDPELAVPSGRGTAPRRPVTRRPRAEPPRPAGPGPRERRLRPWRPRRPRRPRRTATPAFSPYTSCRRRPVTAPARTRSPPSSRSASRTSTLMLANRTSGLAKMECDPVAKSVSRDPTVSTRSASRARVLVAGVPSRPMPPTCHQAAVCTAPLPANVSATGAPTTSARGLEFGGGVGVDHPAAGDDQRLLRRRRAARRPKRSRPGGGGPADGPVPLGEELGRVVVGVGLHVLRQGQHHRARR